MMILALVWVLVVLGEVVTYAKLPLQRGRMRSFLLGLLLVLLVASSALRLWAGWLAWSIFAVLAMYRIVNLLRFWSARLPERQLRAGSLHAQLWLVSLQAGVLIVGSVVDHEHLGGGALAVLATAQLLAILVLLRASLHTWQHAHPFVLVEPMSDRELPSLSVLVPARNETKELERCLQQLLASDYPKLEIIVLDDNSATRRTPDIIRSFAHEGVRFVKGAEPDERNWLAKNHAYSRLSEEASGDLLLFCGVDAVFETHSLRRLVEVLQSKQKDMLSVLPLKDSSLRPSLSLLQPMRYYWELCLPRRFFKRPPVMSTCWLIRAEALKRAGGFQAVARSIAPEAYFARQAVVTDAYSFIRSNSELGIFSAKPVNEQYATSVRVRYPQLHRRLELVAITTLLELALLIGPLAGICLSAFISHRGAYIVLWLVCLACMLVTYYLAAVGTRLNNPLIAWLLMPFAFASDIVMQHISLFKYEFSRVEWKGRDVTVPVMRVEPRLPKPEDKITTAN